jgi:hypothetical protein
MIKTQINFFEIGPKIGNLTQPRSELNLGSFFLLTQNQNQA